MDLGTGIVREAGKERPGSRILRVARSGKKTGNSYTAVGNILQSKNGKEAETNKDVAGIGIEGQGKRKWADRSVQREPCIVRKNLVEDTSVNDHVEFPRG